MRNLIVKLVHKNSIPGRFVPPTLIEVWCNLSDAEANALRAGPWPKGQYIQTVDSDGFFVGTGDKARYTRDDIRSCGQ